MQQNFTYDLAAAAAFRLSTSHSRFERYLKTTDDNQLDALMLYRWNTLVSQSLYPSLQAWEICFRNKINNFLKCKYGDRWQFDTSKAFRNFKKIDQRRVLEAVNRQQRQRNTQFPSSCSIVADLSVGFWVSQLSEGYFVPYSWNYNISRVFPNSSIISHKEAHNICSKLLILRNRIAHHEPIFHMPLDEINKNLLCIIEAMCETTSIFAKDTCNFEDVWKYRPLNLKATT